MVQIVTNAAGAPEEVVLNVGYVTLPLVSGSPEAQRTRLLNLKQVEATVVGRYSMTRARLAELVEALTQARENWDKLASE